MKNRVSQGILAALILGAVTSGAAEFQNPFQATPVTLEVRYLQAPRADVNRVFPKVSQGVSPDALRQLQQWVGQNRAKILAQQKLTTASGVQGHSDTTNTLAGTTQPCQLLLDAVPTLSADETTIGVRVSSGLHWPLTKAAPAPTDAYDWQVLTSVVLQSGTTALLAILEPVMDAHYYGANDIVLVLLMATVPPAK